MTMSLLLVFVSVLASIHSSGKNDITHKEKCRCYINRISPRTPHGWGVPMVFILPIRIQKCMEICCPQKDNFPKGAFGTNYVTPQNSWPKIMNFTLTDSINTTTLNLFKSIYQQPCKIESFGLVGVCRTPIYSTWPVFRKLMSWEVWIVSYHFIMTS